MFVREGRLVHWLPLIEGQDGSLKRCYGVNKKVIECDWNYIKTLRTINEPSQSMPTFEDLLHYLREPGVEHIWLMLDIKVTSIRQRTLVKYTKVDTAGQ